MVVKIGFKTKTQEISYQKIWIQTMQFMNSVVLIVLMGAKLDFIPVVGNIFDGSHRDFTACWYDKIGSIFVVTMAIYIINPFIELIVTLMTQKIFLWYDQGKFFN